MELFHRFHPDLGQVRTAGSSCLVLECNNDWVNKKKDSDLRVVSLGDGAPSREARSSLLRVLDGCSSGPVLSGGIGQTSEQSPRALCTKRCIRTEMWCTLLFLAKLQKYEE